MIESGSHVPGVSAADFALPHHTALRLELPAPELRGCLSDYHVLDSEGPQALDAVSWVLPAWPAIRFIMTDRRMRLEIGRRIYDPVPLASVYGTTSRAMRLTTNGGVTIGIGLRPAAWARLFRRPADQCRDRLTLLHELMAPGPVDALIERLRRSDQGPGVKAILDAFFAEALGPPHPDEPLIEKLGALIADEEVRDLGQAGERVGIGPAALRRLSARYFGFPPKTLLNRTRFLRSLNRMIEADATDYALVGPTYFDASHFLRDGYRFLGMTPRRFLQQYENPYPKAVNRARRIVMEAARRAGR